MWNSGMTFSERSAAVRCSDSAMPAAEHPRLRWRSGTIFGREVVPEVCSTSATSSGPGATLAPDGSARWLPLVTGFRPSPE